MNMLIPLVDKVRYVHSLKEIPLDIPGQSVSTLDNVPVLLEAILFIRVVDPRKASYEVEDPEYALVQLAQTAARAEVARLGADQLARERDNLCTAVLDTLSAGAQAWGIDCLRYEVRELRLPTGVQVALQGVAEAERRRQAALVESEGQRQAEVNLAEGRKAVRILESEAARE